MENSEFPLREKMTGFWRNQLLRGGAFGNYRVLTKRIVRSNAMLTYLDNIMNKKGNINENLARELLEFFTLGIRIYTEKDVRSEAKSLAGLSVGSDHGVPKKKDRQRSGGVTWSKWHIQAGFLD